MVQSRHDVLDTLRAQREQLRALGVSRLGLFGSFSQDRPRQDSDVDLLIEFRPGEKSFDNFMAVSELLEALFARRVELVTPESLSPYIGPHILREVEYVSVAD
jgi:predicted nucleotidyltransferase